MNSLPPDEAAPAACNLPWSLAVAGSGCRRHWPCIAQASTWPPLALDGAIAGRGGGAVAIVGEDWIEVHLVQAKGQKGPFTTQIHEKEIREERKYT